MTAENALTNAAAAWTMSRDFLEACDLLAAAGKWDRAVSQLYYAVHHVVRALLFTEGVEPRTHKGAHHLLRAHFVLNGALDAEHARLLQDLQAEREQADYAGTYPNDRRRYEDLRARADGTLRALQDLLAARKVPGVAVAGGVAQGT